MFSSGASNAAQTPAVTHIKVQTSVQGACIPLVYGECRLAGNLIGVWDFKSKKQDQAMGGSGMGGGSTSSWQYSVSFAMAICAGPAQVLQVYRGKAKRTPVWRKMTVFPGTRTQAPWGYLTTHHPDDALCYPGLCYVAKAAQDLGSSPSLPNFNFEVAGLCQNVADQVDVDPADMILDVLTDPFHGAGFPAGALDLSTYSDYCRAAGFLISIALTDQNDIRSTLQDIIDLTNSGAVWSGGKLTIVPFGDEEITGNGRTYTPPAGTVADLTANDFGKRDAGPITIMRRRRSDIYNAVKLECFDRTTDYNAHVVDARDETAIAKFGLRQEDVKTAHIFCDPVVGQLAAQLHLQRQSIPNSYEFPLGWRHILLDPMDIVSLTYPALGLDAQRVRIMEISEDDKGELTFRAEEVVDGTGSAPSYPTQGTNGYNPDYDIDPGPCNTPIIFEPPAILAKGGPELWAVVSGAGEFFGGCQVYVSLDGESYSYVGCIIGQAKQGVLTAEFPDHVDPDKVDTLSVDMSMSGQELNSVTQKQCNKFQTLSYVGGELVSYQTATLTGPSCYDLGTRIRRGVYKTTHSSHLAGTPFARLDSGVFKWPYDVALIGESICIKFVAWNIWQGGLQDIAEVEPVTVIPGGASVQPSVTDLLIDEETGTPIIDEETGDFIYCDPNIDMGDAE